MAINDNATLVIATGKFYTAAVGTAMPTSLLAPPVAWTEVGHTSLEDIFSMSSEGGEATTIGTLQNKALRTKYSARTETMAFTLQQFDTAGLKLYYGSNAVTLADGSLGVPTEPIPTSTAFLCVFIDGYNHFAFYCPKSEVYRNDDMSLSDTESLAGLPLGVKPIAYGANAWTYAVTPMGAVATGAAAGIPGTFTPFSAAAPANLAAMSGIVASPATSWTSGQYITLADGTLAHWNATTWVAGAKP